MVGAFFYLTFCSIRNRLRVRLRRLREPRYAVGLIVGGLYLYRFLFRNLFRPSRTARPTGTPMALLARFAAGAQLVSSLGLFFLAAVAWLLPGFKPPLRFSRAEVQFLFQAPLSRRQLVHYKLIRTHLGTLFASALITLLLRPPSSSSGWMFLAGIWLVSLIVSLHGMAISLTRESLARRPKAGFLWIWLMAAAAAGSIVVLGLTVALHWTHLVALAGPADVFHAVETLMSTGAAAIVLWPFRAVVRVPLAQTPAEFWSALPAAALILAANYVWVLRADVGFEEASAEQAERTVAQLASARAPARVRLKATPTPFALSSAGPPEMAILWKNLIMLGRYASLTTLMRFLPLLVLVGMFAQRPGSSGGVMTALALACLFGVAVTIFLGPFMARNDLRQDLESLAVLKTWPINGATLVRGELLAPLIILTMAAWVLILGGVMLSGRLPVSGQVSLTIMTHRLSYATAAALIAPALILAQLVVQNGIAIAFPAWTTIGVSRARGIEIMGQRMVLMAGIAIALLLFILPAAVVAAVVVSGLYLLTHATLAIVPALIIALVMLLECWLAVEALGRLLDRTDISAVPSGNE